MGGFTVHKIQYLTLFLFETGFILERKIFILQKFPAIANYIIVYLL